MLARILADRWLRPEVAYVASGATLVVWMILAVVILASSDGGGSAFGSNLISDYGQFYVAGQILNEGSGSRLYDLDYQDERLHQLLPKLLKNEHLPFAYPPFLALIFRPLARLPFLWSQIIWLLISVVIYATAIRLVLRACESIPSSERNVAWLLAFSIAPFTMECGLGGQISVLGAAVIAGTLILQKRDKPLASGLVLAFLFYKPTLLVLILPMLLLGRAWKVLAGLFAGAIVLAVVSWLVAGTAGCLDFLGLMAGYGRVGGSVGQGFKTIKYLDLTAFLRLLGVAQGYARPLACLIGLPILVVLMIAWVKTVRGRIRPSVWSSTALLTPILNIYGPIYDVTVAMPALLIGANAIRARSHDGWPVNFRWLVALLYASALLTQPMAIRLGFQPLTLSLLALGGYILATAPRDPAAMEQGGNNFPTADDRGYGPPSPDIAALSCS